MTLSYDKATWMRLAGLVATLGIESIALAQRDYLYAVFAMPTLGGEDAHAWGLSPTGDVVGTGELIDGTYHATLWSGGFLPADLGTLGGNYSHAEDVNTAGDIVGWATYPGGRPSEEHATLWRGGQIFELESLGGTQSTAEAVNERGEIVGWSNLEGDANWHACVWRDGMVEDLGTFDTHASEAYAINAGGVIVGTSASIQYGEWRAALWENGNIVDLGTLRPDGRGRSEAYDINDAGYVVGDTAVDSLPHLHAFVWFNGEMHDLGVLPGKKHSFAMAINNHNQITGWSTIQYPNDDAFLWEPGRGMQRLDSLIAPRSGWRFNDTWDINDAGQIVGNGIRNGDRSINVAFLLSPVQPTMTLAAPTPGTAGVANTITISGVTPGARVAFMYSLHGGGTRIDGCDLQQNALQLDSPTVIGTAIADQSGVATITRTVPPVAQNQTILFQAVVQNECAISQLVVHRFE